MPPWDGAGEKSYYHKITLCRELQHTLEPEEITHEKKKS